MDDTSHPAPLADRRRRLLFRANHRGTRENDLLIGGFVTAGIAGFSDAELDGLEALLDVPDPVISDWLIGRAPVPSGFDMALLDAMRTTLLERAKT